VADTPDIAIDRLLAGEMSAEEQRRLAQAALDDPNLFDTLTVAAVVRSTLSEPHRSGAQIEALPPALLQPRRGVWLASALAVAATIVMTFVYVRTRPSVAPVPAAAAVAEPPVSIAPVLLTARAAATPTDTFRSNPTSSRLPKRSGTIVTIRDGIADIDIGSLDGISEGLNVNVLGVDGGSERGQLTITTVFRERSRGRLTAIAPARVGDRVEVSAGVHVTAALEQATARETAQDVAAVRALLELAASTAESRDVPANLRRQARQRLAVFKHRSGDLGEAERLLTLASAEFETPPVASVAERADLLNELGVVQIEQREYSTGERTLRSAESYASDAARMRILNNLGAIAALGGNRTQAKSLYESAAVLAGNSPELASDRAAIETNLNTLGNKR
jgi:hypothetical protein